MFARKKGTATEPNPVDRGKTGSKLHILTEAGGLPLAMGISGANTHDMKALKPLVHTIPEVRSRRGPRRPRPAKLHADKGYDYEDLRRWLRARNIVPRIARIGVDTHARLGRYRWRVERTFSWLFNYRRLAVRWERNASNFTGMLTLAAADHLLQEHPQMRRPLSSKASDDRDVGPRTSTTRRRGITGTARVRCVVAPVEVDHRAG